MRTQLATEHASRQLLAVEAKDAKDATDHVRAVESAERVMAISIAAKAGVPTPVPAAAVASADPDGAIKIATSGSVLDQGRGKGGGSATKPFSQPRRRSSTPSMAVNTTTLAIPQATKKPVDYIAHPMPEKHQKGRLGQTYVVDRSPSESHSLSPLGQAAADGIAGQISSAAMAMDHILQHTPFTISQDIQANKLPSPFTGVAPTDVLESVAPSVSNSEQKSVAEITRMVTDRIRARGINTSCPPSTSARPRVCITEE